MTRTYTLAVEGEPGSYRAYLGEGRADASPTAVLREIDVEVPVES
jgi:hypothetical protein